MDFGLLSVSHSNVSSSFWDCPPARRPGRLACPSPPNMWLEITWHVGAAFSHMTLNRQISITITCRKKVIPPRELAQEIAVQCVPAVRPVAFSRGLGIAKAVTVASVTLIGRCIQFYQYWPCVRDSLTFEDLTVPTDTSRDFYLRRSSSQVYMCPMFSIWNLVVLNLLNLRVVNWHMFPLCHLIMCHSLRSIQMSMKSDTPDNTHDPW